MAQVQYKLYKVQIDGDKDYIAGVTACLDLIESVADGKKLLQAITTLSHQVFIQDTVKGNSCLALGGSASPPLTVAIVDKNAASFTKELKAAVDKAKSAGMTLEHLGRQLAMGLSPATYQSADNVVRPAQKSPAPAGSSAQDVMFNAGLQTGTAMSILQDLISGKRSVNNLPADWDYELPRLLRPYLTLGTGSASRVSFNHEKTFHCTDDPAMYLRPPAIGLAHEMIHALHNSSGRNLRLVVKNDEKLEEVVTTGMPPYNYEELSDNKMRSQWPQYLQLRVNY